jgi:hypothetical protein
MLWLIPAAMAAAVQPPLRPELEPMRYLVGHCWQGVLDGAARDTHCFQPVFDGQHIRDRHEVTGAAGRYRGETLYSWNGAARRVEYSYWNSLGGIIHGTMVPAEGRLDFTAGVPGADGRTVDVFAVWRRVGDRSYEAVTNSAANPTGARIVRFTRLD